MHATCEKFLSAAAHIMSVIELTTTKISSA